MVRTRDWGGELEPGAHHRIATLKSGGERECGSEGKELVTLEVLKSKIDCRPVRDQALQTTVCKLIKAYGCEARGETKSARTCIQ